MTVSVGTSEEYHTFDTETAVPLKPDSNELRLIKSGDEVFDAGRLYRHWIERTTGADILPPTWSSGSGDVQNVTEEEVS